MAWSVRTLEAGEIGDAYSGDFPYLIQGNTKKYQAGVLLWLEMDLEGNYAESIDDFYPPSQFLAVRSDDREEAIALAKKISCREGIQTRVWNLIDLKMEYLSPEIKPMQDWIYADEHISYSTPPVLAGQILANAWLEKKSLDIHMVDLWNTGAVFCKEFVEAFLERTEQVGCLESATKIKWEFDCETAGDLDPDYVPCYIRCQTWVNDYVIRRKRDGYLALAKSYTNCPSEKYWDVGEEDIISPSKDNLYSIMNALILCKGKMYSSHSLENRDGKWEYATRSCAVALRISLPSGMESRFEELSKFKLTEPPKVHLN